MALTPPFLEHIQKHQRILIAGMGGGFDLYCGLPLYFALRDAGKDVFLANLSFTSLDRSSAPELYPHLYEVTHRVRNDERYYPELYLSRWFKTVLEQEVPIYAFERVGVRPLYSAYEFLTQMLEVDAVVLVDGGTDSLMRGDEFDLGTPEEDAASLAAVNALENENLSKYLLCLGFGVDTFHGVCHHYFLEAVAALTQNGHYLGAWSLTPEMPEVKLYDRALEFAHAAFPDHPSIVNSSILDGIAGKFGNVHRTYRTQGSELYINPLMGLYWAFRLEGVTWRNKYLSHLMHTETYGDVRHLIAAYRAETEERPWQSLPV